MSDKFKIIKAREQDAEAIQKARIATWRNAYAHIFPEEVFKEQELNLPKHIEVALERLKQPDQYYYVAIAEGKVVGILAVMLLSKYQRYKSLGYADLEGIYVLPEYQGLGIGNKFFETAVKVLLENGASKMVIGVLKDNKKARAVYEKWGGVLDSYEQPFKKMDKEYDEVFYKFEPLSAFRKSSAKMQSLGRSCK